MKLGCARPYLQPQNYAVMTVVLLWCNKEIFTYV